MLLTSSLLIDFILLLLASIFLLHKYVSYNYDYWKKRGIFFLKPMPFIGNLYDTITFKSSVGTWQNDIYNSTNEPYVGIFLFNKPALILKSPELIKKVLINDFNHFAHRTIFAPEHNELIAQVLFISRGPDWKVMRSKISPAFTSGKLKAMFPTIQDIAHELYQYIEHNKGQLESKELATKYSTEVIGRTAFGVKAGCFIEDDCEFRKIGKSFFDFSWRTAFRQTAYLFMHGLVRLFRIEFADKEAVEYLKNILWDNIKQREKANIKGNDIIDIIIELRNNSEFCKKFKFEGDKVVAQPFQFFTAGIETTSQAIAFTLYELCINPQIQTKLRDEILNHLEEHENVTYDNLSNMKYLDMCILETMRKYPVLPFLDRQCTADWTIPGTDITIDKKVVIYVPVSSLHTDPKYFPEPEKYNPERFADKSTYNKNGLYYLPFGDGPRICLGERLAMISVKLALIHILSHFLIEPTPATPIPLKLTKTFLLHPETGLNMRYVEYDRTRR